MFESAAGCRLILMMGSVAAFLSMGAICSAQPPRLVPDSNPVVEVDWPRLVRGQDAGEEGSFTDSESANSGPNIREPGPDSADLPDSAFAVPPGVVYFETALTYSSSKGPRTRDYFTPTLVRIGVCRDLELRLSGPGIIHEDGDTDNTTGFGPMAFGFKRHIWDEVEDWGIPAFGVIAQVSAPTASAGFDDGTAIPTVFFNFDHTLPADSYFEWNLGISALHDDDGHRFAQGSFLWSLGHEWTPDLTTFFHGFVNVPAGSGDDQEVVLGPGMIWFASDQLAVDFSYNFGLTAESPHRLVRLGLSLAF
ncbi:MAG: transporter [Planctomycetes bacterium]|nr:transporter [Planctomycetota bacterium]